jgi:hypothetical protein
MRDGQPGIDECIDLLVGRLRRSRTAVDLWFLECAAEARYGVGDFNRQGCGGCYWRWIMNVLRRLFRCRAFVWCAWWRWRCGAKG